jgi:hypothetical protein
MAEIDSEYSALIPDLNNPKVIENAPFAFKDHTHHESEGGFTGDIKISSKTLTFKNGLLQGYE